MSRYLSLFLLLFLMLPFAACQPLPAEGNAAPIEATLPPTTIPTATVSPSPSPTPGTPMVGEGKPTVDTFEQNVKGEGLTLTARLQDGIFSLDLAFPSPASSYNAFQVLLDIDGNARSGYRTGILGADLLLENANLFAYTGNGSDWRWLDVTPLELEYRSGGNRVSWQIPLSAWHFICSAVTNKDCLKVFAFGQLADKGWNITSRTPATTLHFPSP